MPWIVRRIGVSLVLVWSVATILFFAIHLVPGDPAEVLLSYGSAAPDPQLVQQLRAKLGLDRPILEQYAHTIAGFAHGDLGRSLQDGASIATEISIRLPRTIELILAATLIAVLIGVPLGCLSAMRRGSFSDLMAGAFASISLSVPIFVVGTAFIMVLSQMLQWVPAGGYTPFLDSPVQHLRFLLMPALTVAVGLCAIVIRMTRASILEVMQRDYVRTARAKGLRPAQVTVRHILRNALMPVVTVIALNIGTLLGGTVLVEFVFNWPGMSGFLVSAVSARDYPTVLGIVLVISTLFIALNLLLDIVLRLLDPRANKA
jgi:peptide/nickel transport system permease protein